MSASQRNREWLEWMLTTSVPLLHLNADDIPNDTSASGCFIDYGGRRFLLSVQHAVNRGARGWVISLGNEPGAGSAIFRLPDFNYVAEMVRGSDSASIRDIDFCYAEIPRDLISNYQNATPYVTKDERPRHVFATNLSDLPDPIQIYGFAGQIKPELHESIGLVTEMVVYPGLRFLRSEGEFHVFQLPVAHPGHQAFKGCSGAPIVDMNKTLVAIVCDGNPSTNTIRGVSIARYKFAFDFVVGPTNGD